MQNQQAIVFLQCAHMSPASIPGMTAGLYKLQYEWRKSEKKEKKPLVPVPCINCMYGSAVRDNPGLSWVLVVKGGRSPVSLTYHTVISDIVGQNLKTYMFCYKRLGIPVASLFCHQLCKARCQFFAVFSPLKAATSNVGTESISLSPLWLAVGPQHC